MDRRDFTKGLAASLAAIPFLPQVGSALASRLESMRTDLAATPMGEGFWRRARKEFTLNPDLIHLNTGSTGACPQMVIDALCKYAREVEGDPQHNLWGGLGNGMEEVRARAAEFIGADTEEVSITRNTTEGLNATAVGLHLKPGDEVLTTDHEHGGGMVGWQYVAKHNGVKVRYLEIPDPIRSKGQLLDLVEQHLTPRTRVCSFSHVCTITGMLYPMAEIAAITRPRDIILVCDGAQVPGMLDVNVKKLGVDVYCSSSHKWMLAPKGSGLFYIRKEVRERVAPPILSHGPQVYTGASGTRNVPTILAHGVAMDFHNAIGRDKVEARCRQLRRLMRQRLEGIPGLTCISPEPEELSSAMCAFSLDPAKGKNGEIAGRMYKEHNIVIKTAQGTYAYVPPEEAHPRNPNALRFSTHIFNNEDQVERAAAALRRMLS